jgi:putative ABC transport system permease protein
VDSIVGPFRKTLFTLGAAVALLLLIACANVANMLLARSTARDREMAIRAALGASQWRVVRQLLVESVLLALGGTLAGCGFAYAGIRALVATIPDGAIPKEAEIGLDLPVLAFSLALTVFTALLFGLAPALPAPCRRMAASRRMWKSPARCTPNVGRPFISWSAKATAVPWVPGCCTAA